MPRNLQGAGWEPVDLASYTNAVDFHHEPCSPTVTFHPP